tara:strand:+ start:72 stop:416 length:345 start_codon:yes stop_codon:yes gene_type:complete
MKNKTKTKFGLINLAIILYFAFRGPLSSFVPYEFNQYFGLMGPLFTEYYNLTLFLFHLIIFILALIISVPSLQNLVNSKYKVGINNKNLIYYALVLFIIRIVGLIVIGKSQNLI